MYFFIGTEAELIKLFPVIIGCQKKGNVCHIIASGQNDLMKSRILEFINLNGQFLGLSSEKNIKKSAVGLLKWFFQTYIKAVSVIKNNFINDDLSGSLWVIHGDTISTVMGAMIGKKLHMKICHIEAGLRSYNLFNPFPEEIDRLITSRLAEFHFAPGKEAVENLNRMRKNAGKIIDTKYNTILDSLMFSKSVKLKETSIKMVQDQDYFVFVMHRQENLMDDQFVRQVMKEIKDLSRKKLCVIILHKITENKFRDLGMLEYLEDDEHFFLLPRIDYFDFMKLLEESQYVVTDGGSNQEELYYMGKPCMIMRKNTERQEGIGDNAVMFSGKMEEIKEFGDGYMKYQRNPFIGEYSPSKIICDKLNMILSR